MSLISQCWLFMTSFRLFNSYFWLLLFNIYDFFMHIFNLTLSTFYLIIIIIKAQFVFNWQWQKDRKE